MRSYSINPDVKAENRSSIARKTLARLRKRGRLSELIVQSRDLSRTLRQTDANGLLDHMTRLRRFALSGDVANEDRLVVLAAAATIESIRRNLGLELFDVQLRSGIIVAAGAVAEMQTGEGKTLAVALPAVLRALGGRGVHVATPNDYLACRDHEKLAKVFAALGITSGLITQRSSASERHAAYRADITYAAAHTFGFDYLRDQLALEADSQIRWSDRVFGLASGDTSGPQLLQRGLSSTIVDEIDHVLIDDAVSPLILSGAEETVSADADTHHAAREWSERLSIDVDYVLLPSGQVRLTQSGFSNVYGDSDRAVDRDLVRPWHEYVVAALRALHFYRRDVHYIVRDGRVHIVETSTGRVFTDRTWSEGLQQAIEAREGLPIRAETRPMARITRQRFFRQYGFVGGMTGTAGGCERELAAVYGLPVQIVAPRIPSRRVELPQKFSVTANEKWSAIADETESMVHSGRAVLIGTLSIAESVEVARTLRERGIDVELLNGVQDADEADLIAVAGRRGAVTVATHLAGRGTDIVLDDHVAKAGGLHVIVAQKHSIGRVDRQLIGRCARCGDPGSARAFVSAVDTLTNQHAPWIGRAILRLHARGSDATPDLDKQLTRAQSRIQKHETANRCRMLRSDRDDERLHDRRTMGLTGCWQL